MVGIVPLYEEEETRVPHPLSLPCEDTARRQPSANQGVGSRQMLNLPAP